MTEQKRFLKSWDNLPFVIFVFRDAYYAINAEFVESIVFLPELSPLVEAPSYFVGVFNLRGKVLPVMDLDKRFGYASQPYSLTDSVIVVEYGHEKAGIIVNEIHDLQKISVDLIENRASITEQKKSNQSIIAGQIKTDDRIITLLDHTKLIQHSIDEDDALAETPMIESKERKAFSSSINTEEEEIFHKRALDLMPSVEKGNLRSQEGYAVFTLSGEVFGIDIDLVKEFSEVTKVFPSPCCPAFILGDINLRGDILTLVDIRSFLNLSVANEIQGKKVVVVQTEGLIVGIQVDEVLDVIKADSYEILPAPDSVKNASEDFVKGVFPYKKDMMALINLSRLLASESLVVNEEV
jgi:purine-binding chemotaxis protein CheW